MIPASWRARINSAIAKISSGDNLLLGCCSAFIVEPPSNLLTRLYTNQKGVLHTRIKIEIVNDDFF